ncbi:MAG: DUF2807 domain-containing protein [Bacteroidota bacterium]
MKKLILVSTLFLVGLMLSAQNKIALADFSKITVPANFEVKLAQSASNQIEFSQDQIKRYNTTYLEKGFKVENGTLTFNLGEFNSALPVEVTIYSNNLQEIRLEGNGQIGMATDSVFKVPSLKVYADGATKADLYLEVDKLVAEINGASKLVIDGKATEAKLEATGASKIEALGMAFENLDAEASGASKIRATVKNNLKVSVSGLSKMEYAGNPKNIEKEVSGGAKLEQTNEDENSGSISAGVDINKGRKHRNKKRSTNMETAFGGIEIGVGGLVTPDMNTTLAASNKNLETNFGSSWRFAINFGDWDIPIVKGRLAFTTGLGLSFDHYGFKNKDSVISDNSKQLTFDAPAATLSTNRLSQFNLTLPLLLKYNSNYNKHDDRFYVAAGVIVNYSVTNSIYTEYSKNGIDYENRASGDFFVNRLRADATVRIGYSFASVFVNYGLVPLFETANVADTRTIQTGIALNF